MLNVAILDDYCNSALGAADWSQLPNGASVTVFDRPLGAAEAADILAPYDVLCTVRERMPLPRTLLERLRNLKLIVTVGEDIANLDRVAAAERGIAILATELAFSPRNQNIVLNATPEFAWGLMMATVRQIAREDRRMRSGAWQSTLGMGLTGRTLGVLGLGATGKRMARYAQAFDMDVIAWSENLSHDTAHAAGCRRVGKMSYSVRRTSSLSTLFSASVRAAWSGRTSWA